MDEDKIVLSMFVGLMLFGAIVGAIQFFNDVPSEAEASATIYSPPDVHHSTAIQGIFLVKTSNVSGNESDNLFADPSGIVEASITSSGGSATLEWGVDYTLAVASWGEDNETSLDVSNLRLGIDGDYWGDGDGSVQMPGENITYEYEYATGFTPDGEDQQHHAVNYWAKDQNFTPSRDESISIDNILLQAYF